jgi:hypothetical protein
MAISYTNDGASNIGPSKLLATPEKYVSLGDLIGDYAKPDNRDLLISTYGDQGITGFLQLTGAVTNAGTQDEVQYWEEGRLHRKVTGAISTATLTLTDPAGTGSTPEFGLRLNDVLLTDENERLVVTALGADAATDGYEDSYTVKRLDGAGNPTGTYGAGSEFAIIGNIFAQGSDQPGRFREPGITKRVNPFIITKETYAVNGSQATNIGWVNIGNGDYRWYVKGEMDTRKRFMNQREMMLLYGQKAATDGTEVQVPIDDTTTLGKVAGSEGYFAAVENRGLVADVSGGAQGTFADMSDIDGIILELDKEGAPAEYAMYLNRAASLDIDDMLAQGIATQVTAGLPGQFGAFNNDSDMAVKLGFKSFTRGGYTFHKHDWKLLNDPMLGAIGTIKGAMVPLANVVDPRTGNSAPALEMNYKGTNGYNRDMEHWVRGSILGHTNLSKDVAEFYYRSECNLITRAANQHVLIK